MPHYPFTTVDVFTTKRFGGNPLAVITDARGLTSKAMQAIAAEFGYAETTFVLPPENPAHSAQIRIFTPVTEVPFAGHPNVGTSFVLGHQKDIFGKPPGERLIFEEAAGLVEIDLVREGGRLSSSIRAPRQLSLGSSVDVDLVARCASLAVGDIDLSNHAPLFLSVGLKFVVAEVTDLNALGRAQPVKSVFLEGVQRYPHEESDFALFLYTRIKGDSHLRARMFAPLDNVSEDPATGSASAALAAFLSTLREPGKECMDILIEQGVEMGRPSEIRLSVRKREDGDRDVRISGNSVYVMSGTIEV